ncbi:MAG: ribosomal RNA small subunit methyltransferase I [bacterium]
MLYIVGTPLGNFEDLSIRQAKTLVNSDFIFAEDTRSTQVLLNYCYKLLKIKTLNYPQLISYYKEKELEKLSLIIDFLNKGKNVSLVSEAGMPLISDPGYLLIKELIRKGLQYKVISGSTAITTALLYSGMQVKNFIFLGFVPKNNTHTKKLIKQIIDTNKIFKNIAFVLYVSIYRYNDTMEILNNLIPEAEICICREMTKKFEEIIRGNPKDLLDKRFKGELTMVVSL